MNKNKKYYIVIFIATISFITSCNDNFLERYPLTSISDGSYWNSPNDLKNYANRFYSSSLFPVYDDYSMGPFGLDADNGSDTQIHRDFNTRMNGDLTVPASGGAWSTSDWSLLRSLNYFMDNYSKVTDPWDAYKQYVGEILFFRSMFYFDKLIQFGDLPYVSTALYNDSKILFEGRLPRNQVVDSIMRDMDLAVDYLPARTATWTGRITKETAMLLQARIALYEGTWEKYHAKKNTPFSVAGSNGDKFIRKAAEVSGALMGLAESSGLTGLANVGVSNGYSLLFNQKDYSANREVLFWRKYEDAVISRISEGLWTGGQRGITKRLIDQYLCTDGMPISLSPLYQGDKDLRTVVTNRDPRLDQTIAVDDGKHIEWYQLNTYYTYPDLAGESSLPTSRPPTYYHLYKGRDGDRDEYLSHSNPSCGTIYFRYGEALLIYAEARAELGEITQSDIDKTVNALRARAGLPTAAMLNISNITTDPNWLFSSINPLLNEIRRERTVELACEGFRREDIFRWAAADELIKGYIPKGAVWEQWRDYPGTSQEFKDAWVDILNRLVGEDGYVYPWKESSAVGASGYKFNTGRDYLLPLPSDQLVLNPNLKQNPGWD